LHPAIPSIVPAQHESILPPYAERGFAAGACAKNAALPQAVVEVARGRTYPDWVNTFADKDFVHE